LEQTYATASFPEDLHGLPGLRVSAEGGSAFIACQGAQVLSWRTGDGKERLYLSPLTGGMSRAETPVAQSPAIRGGIPVCFPQFADRGGIVKHGFARNMPWSVSAHDHHARREHGGHINTVALRLGDDMATKAIWPHAFEAKLVVETGQDFLAVSLSVTNSGDAPWEFTAALHTYLKIGDARNTSISGLGKVRYQDATAANAVSVQEEEDLRITDEVDRVYLSPPKELRVLEDGQPSLCVSQQGFEDTVIWNPGSVKARALPDFPDDDWLRMLCVEAACVVRPVSLRPGESWRGSQTLRVPR
jgi:glucose-6-phosphate 1-epimerase